VNQCPAKYFILKKTQEAFNLCLYAVFVLTLFSCSKTPTRNVLSEKSTLVVGVDIKQFIQSLHSDTDLMSIFSAEKDLAKANITNPGIDIWGEAFLYKVSNPGCSETVFFSLPISNTNNFKKLLEDKIPTLHWTNDGHWVGTNVQWNIHIQPKFALMAFTFGKKNEKAVNEVIAEGIEKINNKITGHPHPSLANVLNKQFSTFVWAKKEGITGIYEDILANLPFEHVLINTQFKKGHLAAEMVIYADGGELSAIHKFMLAPISNAEFYNYHLSADDAISVAMHFNIPALKNAIKHHGWFERFSKGVMMMGHDTTAMMQMFSGNVVCSIKEANHQGGLIPQFELHLGLADAGYGESFLNDMEFLGAIKQTAKDAYLIPMMPGYELATGDNCISLKFTEETTKGSEFKTAIQPHLYEQQLLMVEVNSKKLAQILKGLNIAQYNIPWSEYMPSAVLTMPDQHQEDQLSININIETAIKEENAFFTLMRMLEHSELRQISKN
jgi:hypothetical protein